MWRRNRADFNTMSRPSIGTLMTPDFKVPPWTEADERGLRIMFPFFILFALILVGFGFIMLPFILAYEKLKQVGSRVRGLLSSSLVCVGA